jgi:hypothetical protein
MSGRFDQSVEKGRMGPMGRIQALRVFRFHHKAGLAAFYRRPSSTSPVAACHFDIHAAILADPGTNKKPTVVF